jgi:hypothetical protein
VRYVCLDSALPSAGLIAFGLSSLVYNHEDHEAHKECKSMKEIIGFHKLSKLRGQYLRDWEVFNVMPAQAGIQFLQ